MTYRSYHLLPLQIDASDLWSDSSSLSPTTLIIIVVVIAVFVVGLVLYNIFKGGGLGGGKGSGGARLFSTFALNRMIKDIPFSYEQRKMLEFVLRTDSVTDLEKSLTTPELLDRHFRRAYRFLEQISGQSKETLYKHAILFSTRNILENSIFGDFSTTRQLKDGTALIVTIGKEKFEIDVISTKGEFLTAETPKNVLGTHRKPPKGTKLSILLFVKGKGFTFETKVAGYTTMLGRSAMQLTHAKLRFLSKRRYRRRQTVIACSLNLVYVEGSGKKQRLVVDKRRLTGNITDISVGGCSTKTNLPIQVGARFKIQFKMDDENLAALGQVLRTNKTNMGTISHIKFLRINQKAMNQINAFVYEYADD
uniref:PilZ domain-containing protein n=1 Tax=uncultured bacterium contig00060 TaxID=1181543 RepID=A0A806KQK1_9BACT|nr:hypothetical protein [uncultured bacterium contig00060]